MLGMASGALLYHTWYLEKRLATQISGNLYSF